MIVAHKNIENHSLYLRLQSSSNVQKRRCGEDALFQEYHLLRIEHNTKQNVWFLWKVNEGNIIKTSPGKIIIIDIEWEI